MSDMTVGTIELDATHRIHIEYDDTGDSDRPNSWNDSDEHWHALNTGRDYSRLNTDNDPHGRAIDQIVELAEEFDFDRYDALTKHFQRAGIAHRIVDLSAHRDYVGEYVVYGEHDGMTAEQLDSGVETMRQYLNGEVYFLSVETLHTWTRDDGEGERTDWEVDEIDHDYPAIGGVYIDVNDEEAVKSYVAWQFSLEGKFGLNETV